MNKRELEVEKHKLKEEKKVLYDLKSQYEKAIRDISRKTQILHDDIQDLVDQLDGGINDNIIMSRIQAKVYQKQYQENLMRQVSSYVDAMNKSQYKSVTDYLNSSYETGYVGSMYDIHGQGVPIIAPIDKKAMTKAVTLDAPISNKLYGTNTNLMKKRIASEISRGIAQASPYADIARNLQNIGNAGFNKSMRIVRTEGHRIQCQSAFDAQHKAKEKGADVVKQWDAALDARTRESHRQVDGQIREIDEKFSNGLMIPGDSSGGAAEVVNCRCALLQRARWALDDKELQVLKDRAEFFELDKTDEFEDFKGKYLSIAKKLDEMEDTREKHHENQNGFITQSVVQYGTTKPYSIIRNMNNSNVGKEMLKYMEDSKTKINLCFGIGHDDRVVGEYNPFDGKINIYCDNQSAMDIAKTVIHELTHKKLNEPYNSRKEEVKCFINETLHEKGKLTEKDLRDIIIFVNKTYSELPWR